MENNDWRHGPVTYETLTAFPEVVRVGPQWDALLEESRCNRAFSCSEWFLSTPELFPALEPFVLIARRGGEIAGIMPLMIDRQSRTAMFPHNWSDYPDIIAQDEDDEVISGLLGLAISGAGEYDRLILKRLRPDSNCVRAAQRLEPDPAVVPGKLLAYSYADLTRGYEVYRKTKMTRKLRGNLKTARNNARGRGIAINELGPGDLAPAELPGVFLSVHQNRFGEHTALRSSLAFLRRLFPVLFAEGRMRVFALSSEGRVVAMHLAMVGRKSLFGWNAGFLPEVASLSPGALLLEEAIRHACLDGMGEYDLGRGQEAYKARWATGSREIGELHFTAGARLLPARPAIPLRPEAAAPSCGEI